MRAAVIDDTLLYRPPPAGGPDAVDEVVRKTSFGDFGDIKIGKQAGVRGRPNRVGAFAEGDTHGPHPLGAEPDLLRHLER